MTAFAGPLAATASRASRHYQHRNANLIYMAAALHIPPGALVADVTWGLGNFWAGVPRWFTLVGSDIAPGRGWIQADFGQLPYRDRVFAAVVFDPPYLVDASATLHVAGRYALQAAGLRLGHAEIMDLYRDGLAEAHRVLEPGGVVMVKGQDQSHRGIELPFAADITAAAGDLGFTLADRFTLQRSGGLHNGGRPSFLLILEKQ